MILFSELLLIVYNPCFAVINVEFVSKPDSIPLAVPDADVQGMVYSKGHVFVSWGSAYNKARIEVIDPEGLTIL